LPLVAWPTSKTSKIFESTPVSSPSGDNAVWNSYFIDCGSNICIRVLTACLGYLDICLVIIERDEAPRPSNLVTYISNKVLEAFIVFSCPIHQDGIFGRVHAETEPLRPGWFWSPPVDQRISLLRIYSRWGSLLTTFCSAMPRDALRTIFL
jgi:hypothetical protein